jgi:hypothetical protein
MKIKVSSHGFLIHFPLYYYFVIQLMRGAISCPTLLDHIGLNAPIHFLRGRHHDVFHTKEGRLSEIASTYLFRLLYQDETESAHVMLGE